MGVINIIYYAWVKTTFPKRNIAATTPIPNTNVTAIIPIQNVLIFFTPFESSYEYKDTQIQCQNGNYCLTN